MLKEIGRSLGLLKQDEKIKGTVRHMYGCFLAYYSVRNQLASLSERNFNLMIQIMRTGMRLGRSKKSRMQKSKVNCLLLTFLSVPYWLCNLHKVVYLN